MSSKIKMLIGIIAFVVLIAGAYFAYSALSESYENKGATTMNPRQTGDSAEKKPAPDFEIFDKDKNSVMLSDFFGKPIVINFWASWCGPCANELPYFETLYKEMGDEVQFLMVGLTDGARETVETASKFVDDGGYTFPAYFDMNMTAGEYGLDYIPVTVTIDKDGNLVDRKVGGISEKELRDFIDAIK